MSEKNNNTIPETEKELAPVEIIGVSFREAGKIYYFAPGGLALKAGDRVIIDTARGE